MADDKIADKLTRDPRTQLPVIDVPPEHAKYFASLKGTVMHWFGVVDKYNRLWNQDRRVAIFSDSCIYLCRLDGGITRCVQVRNIARVLLSENSAIGFQVNAPDYDMLLQFANVQEREAVLTVVKSVYFRLVGADLEIAKLSEDAQSSMQKELRLAKPPGTTLRIEPIRSLKSLMKALDDQRRKEEEDKKIVEQEFRRIKEGLRHELQQYRTEEYDRMADQLAKHAKALEDKDREIIRLKQETVSKDDPELWKQCPNCARMHERLSSNSNDDKQKIMRLEREIESQRHIMEHLQAAIQFRSSNTRTGAGDADSSQLTALRQELNDANRRNKELMHLITQSNVLTAEVKQRAARIATHRDGQTAVTGYTSNDWGEMLAEKEREVKHLKNMLKDATFRHVQELESIRSQFQRYDDQIVDYLEKVFAGAIPASGKGGTTQQMAQATARAARDAAGGGYGSSATALRMSQSTAGDFEPSSPSAGPGSSSYRHFDPAASRTMSSLAAPAPYAAGASEYANGSPRATFNQLSPIQSTFGATPSYNASRSFY
jgi:hypothetical protein